MFKGSMFKGSMFKGSRFTFEMAFGSLDLGLWNLEFGIWVLVFGPWNLFQSLNKLYLTRFIRINSNDFYSCDFINKGGIV